MRAKTGRRGRSPSNPWEAASPLLHRRDSPALGPSPSASKPQKGDPPFVRIIKKHPQLAAFNWAPIMEVPLTGPTSIALGEANPRQGTLINSRKGHKRRFP